MKVSFHGGVMLTDWSSVFALQWYTPKYTKLFVFLKALLLFLKHFRRHAMTEPEH